MAVLIAKNYRAKIAACAQAGAILPNVAQIALGTGTTPWTNDDIGLEAEVPATRKAIDSADLDNLTVTVTATFSGSEIGSSIITEVGYYDADGGFIARAVVKPKEFEPETSITIVSNLQF